MSRPWRVAGCLLVLRDEINERWPERDKASDGMIGDAAHASSDSDHNPFIIDDGVGVVRALDVDVDGIDAAKLAEHLRQLGKKGDKRVNNGGYVIFIAASPARSKIGPGVSTAASTRTRRTCTCRCQDRLTAMTRWAHGTSAIRLRDTPRTRSSGYRNTTGWYANSATSHCGVRCAS